MPRKLPLKRHHCPAWVQHNYSIAYNYIQNGLSHAPRTFTIRLSAPNTTRYYEVLFVGVNTLWLEKSYHPFFSNSMHVQYDCYVNYCIVTACVIRDIVVPVSLLCGKSDTFHSDQLHLSFFARSRRGYCPQHYND